jgi:hypothetical protein
MYQHYYLKCRIKILKRNYMENVIEVGSIRKAHIK